MYKHTYIYKHTTYTNILHIQTYYIFKHTTYIQIKNNPGIALHKKIHYFESSKNIFSVSYIKKHKLFRPDYQEETQTLLKEKDENLS